MKITRELEKIIDISVQKAVKKAATEILKAGEEISKNEEEKKDYFKLTERLLYSYPSLKQQIESVDEYISTVNRGKSKSIIHWTTGGNGQEDIEGRIKSRLDSFERTRLDVLWIENALNNIRYMKEYPVLELRYLKRKDDGSLYSFEEIAAELNIDERTVRRRRSRIINEMILNLWGSESVKEL